MRDFALAFRRQLRSPGQTTTIVLTLALGIGCAAAVLTVANTVLLRRLPVADQDKVIVLSGTPQQQPGAHVPLAIQTATDFGESTPTLARFAMLNFEGAGPVTIQQGERITRLRRSLVSGDYFAVLDAKPLLGRALNASDDTRGAAPVVVISHRAWRNQFESRADIIGQRIISREDGLTSTIVGVMPAGLDYPRGVDMWTPVRMIVPPESMNMLGFDIIARVADNSNAEAVRNALTAHFQRTDAPPHEKRMRGEAVALPELMLGNTRPAIIAFVAASALLLLITCLNVANLLLVSGLARGREVAIRLALGASRLRILREVIAEHALLALMGGVLGAAASAAAVKAFVAVAPAGLPRLDEIHVSPGMLGIALALAVVATLLAALAPAVWVSRMDTKLVTGSGKSTSSGTRSHTGGRRAQLVREILAGAQVTLALLVLSAAGLLGRSLYQLENVELAFDASRLVVAELALPGTEFNAADKQARLHEQFRAKLEPLPGIQGVSAVVSVPFAEMSGWKGKPAAEGQTDEEVNANPFVDFEVVGPSFFKILGLPILRGRAFDESDRRELPLVAVLSASAAQHYWPNADPLGRRIRIGAGNNAQVATVVGVVPDPRYRDLREPRPTMYFPVQQTFFPFAPQTLVVRTTRSPSDVASAIRSALSETAPSAVLARVEPFTALMSTPLAQPRLNAMLLLMFAGAAILLCAIGLFGVLATTVRQRTREFGIRMALGATAGGVSKLIVRRATVVALVGVGVGLAGAVALNRAVASLLFEVSSLDVLTLGGVALFVFAVALVAAGLSARAIGRIHPSDALRAE